jgi:hypothetical protein
MITTPKMLGIVATAFLAGTFIASPELRAYAANTVFSTDIVDGQVMTADLANNAVTAAKIKDGEVKAAEIAANAVGSSEIATDAVGAAELQGVTKLLYGQCVADNTEGSTSVPGGQGVNVVCNINGVDVDDSAIASVKSAQLCFDVWRVIPGQNAVTVLMQNECATTQSLGIGSEISVMVFDK